MIGLVSLLPMAANSNILLTACTFTSPKHVAGIGTSSLAIVALRKPNNFHLLKLLNLHLLKNVGDGVIFVFSRHVSAPIPIVHVGEHWHQSHVSLVFLAQGCGPEG